MDVVFNLLWQENFYWKQLQDVCEYVEAVKEGQTLPTSWLIVTPLTCLRFFMTVCFSKPEETVPSFLPRVCRVKVVVSFLGGRGHREVMASPKTEGDVAVRTKVWPWGEQKGPFTLSVQEFVSFTGARSLPSFGGKRWFQFCTKIKTELCVRAFQQFMILLIWWCNLRLLLGVWNLFTNQNVPHCAGMCSDSAKNCISCNVFRLSWWSSSAFWSFQPTLKQH